MSKPILIIAAIMLIVGIGMCTIDRHVVHTNTAGRPFDWLGDRVKCQKCGAGGVIAGQGYNYHCPVCGADYRARWNAETKEVEVDW